ncbi:hypothetical protein PFAS1_23295 [Pseudomonas frederiksbergensis]|uniref:hypothetical protein n=1 Tax=Pseudomonas frederiksbergensis TaxID=104087 RepID=UPI000958AB6B|nr:hypothetical protein [Pseudomonas frederiksbergensis]APV42107.1 hypothetical protein PFAS1_23295 [Pseudomonas frederiksbergensis]
MGLNKPNQELKRDLQGVASDLKWSAVELLRIAERLRLAGNEADAQAIMRMITIFHNDEDRLTAYAAEVAGERIVRGKSESVGQLTQI